MFGMVQDSYGSTTCKQLMNLASSPCARNWATVISRPHG